MLAGLALVMLVGSPLVAQEKKEEAKKPKAEAKQTDAKKPAGEKKPAAGRKQASLAETTLKQFASIELTEEQKKQIKELAAEYEPKLQAARKKVNELIPADVRKARQEALAQAKKEGKKPAEVVTAFKPTEEQAAAQKAARELNTEFTKKVNEFLTREQKQAIRKQRQNAEEKKPAVEKPAGEKKPAAKKADAKAE
jgi:hypothetical protein